MCKAADIVAAAANIAAAADTETNTNAVVTIMICFLLHTPKNDHDLHRRTCTQCTEQGANIGRIEPWHRWQELPAVGESQDTQGWSSFTNNENHT